MLVKEHFFLNSDYILRIIEQFIQAIASIISSRKAGNYDEAFHQIQNASQRFLNTDISYFLKKTPEELLEHFRSNSKQLDTEQCIFCADLLFETAMIFESKKIEEFSLHSKILCLHLYLKVITKEKQFQTSSYFERVNALIKELEAQAISESVKKSISTYRKELNQKI